MVVNCRSIRFINMRKAVRMKTKSPNLALAETLKGGVIMDVTTPEQAKIAEDAGACAVMALERVPADIRAPVSTAKFMRLTMTDTYTTAITGFTSIFL